VRKKLVAEIVFDIAGDADQDDAHPILKDALEDRKAHQDGRELKDDLEAEAGGERIDASADHQRKRSTENILQHQRPHAQGQAAAIAPKIRPDALENGSHPLHAHHHYMPSQEATVLVHSRRKVLRPSRCFHQPSGVK
jgi:hypothetical protein